MYKGFQSGDWKRYGKQDFGIKQGGIMKTLKEVACGQSVKVKRLAGEGPIKRRIMDMGITKGVSIFVRKVAPF